MRRSDLPKNEPDWQILDSTPVQMCDGKQKISIELILHIFNDFTLGIRRTGPCSVSSLKKGDLGFRWDSPYIRSSINGNKNHWLVYPDGNMELLGEIDRLNDSFPHEMNHCLFFFRSLRCSRKSSRYENCYKIIEE